MRYKITVEDRCIFDCPTEKIAVLCHRDTHLLQRLISSQTFSVASWHSVTHDSSIDRFQLGADYESLLK